MCNDLCEGLKSKTKTNLADLFAEAISENTKLDEIDAPFFTDEMLKNRHKTEIERQESDEHSKGTVRVTDAMKKHKLMNIQLGDDESYQLNFIEREVPHLRGQRGAKPRNKAWIDYIGVTNGQPILGEIKCGSDQNPFYAFIQLLTYLSEMATPSQIQRAMSQELFSEQCKAIDCFDLHILLTNFNERSEKKGLLRERTEELAQQFKHKLKQTHDEYAKVVGRVLCLSTMVEDMEAGKNLDCCWDA
jgi:hypothetical protein